MKRCPSCGQMNEDDLPICTACGEFFDRDARLITQLEKNAKTHHAAPAARTAHDDEDVELHPIAGKEEKSGNAAILIVAGLVVVAAVVLAVLLL